ncbi:ABC transporter permease [Oceanirhabdus seepicola]|uniref:ABC transporter permease n=1 Tax=Oceanirhabdus seepicola TaxID=2828781 RepID=A0A9J6NXH8_9CLOT|nr:ABC transporter permease [Oceanirhabdus seepicola]MCM1988963.1 ABC transporter permease [Oceanirhabdus seepicola]
MFKFIVRRLLITIGVLFGVSLIIFSLVHMQPGNPYSTMIDPSVPKEVLEEMLMKVGYYDPIHVKYIKWITRALKGDLGYSIYYGAPVLDVINSRMGNTILLSSFALLVSMLIAVPSGVISAAKKNSIFDYIVTIISLIGISIPAFFFGLLLIKWLAFDIKIFPVSGMQTIGEHYTGLEKIIDIGKHIILPGMVLAFLQMASFMRYTRASMLEVLNKDYMRTARGKGLTLSKSIWKHGFRNALIPLITILCMQIPFLFSGALLTETIFVWPGIGRLNYEALLHRDYPLLMGLLMIIAVIILLSNLLADILYAVVDPRITYK